MKRNRLWASRAFSRGHCKVTGRGELQRGDGGLIPCPSARAEGGPLRVETRYAREHFPGIFSDLHFGNHFGRAAAPGAAAKPKVSKPEMCRAIGAVALVDDSADYAAQCAEAGVPTVLFGEYGWNRTFERTAAAAYRRTGARASRRKAILGARGRLVRAGDGDAAAARGGGGPE